MDVKSICRDPRKAIADTWGSIDACGHAADIEGLAARLSVIKSDVKTAKQEKGRISGQFKEAKGEANRLEELKAAMATISARLATLEQERKDVENRLLAYFEPKAENATDALPPFPKRFDTSQQTESDASTVKVIEADEEDAASWDSYVACHVGSSLYHLYAWKRIIERAFGHQCHYYAAKDQAGSIKGLLPVVHLQSRLFGSYAVSVPFFNYGGVIADSPRIEQALMQHAGAEASRLGWEHIEYRTCREGLNLPCASRKVSMILRLPDSPAQLDKDLGAKVRAQCKQAQSRAPSIEFGGKELIDDYYRVFARNMRDLGTPVYAKAFFASILEEFPGKTRLVVVKVGGSPVGAAFLAGYRDMLEIPWASTLKEYNTCNINMWMYRRILDHAIDNRYTFFDFGRSTLNAGTYHFKKQWGAKPLNHYWYYQLSHGQDLPGLNPDNPKYRLAIAMWKKLPVFIANLAGPAIVKNLP